MWDENRFESSRRLASFFQVIGFKPVNGRIHMKESRNPLDVVQVTSEQLIGYSFDPTLLQRFDRIVAVNDECLQLFGAQNRSELVGKSLMDLISPVSHAEFADQQELAASQRRRSPMFHVTIHRLDGSTVRVRCAVAPATCSDESVAFVVVLRGSSLEQSTIPDRQGSEIPLRTILETAMDGIISMDENQEIVLFNSAAEQIFGWRVDQVLGQRIDVLIPDRFRAHHHRDVQQFGADSVERRRMGEQRTVMALRASGEEFPIEASISKTTVNDRQIYTVILRDVTQAARYRQQIEQQSQMLDQVTDAVSLLDLNGRVVYWNQGAARLFGWSAAEAIGRDSRQLIYRGDAQSFLKMQHETNQKGSWAGELPKTHRSGAALTVEHHRTVLRDEAGMAKGYVCIDIDITDRKKRERAAHRSQRLESIGTLAGGIAHDLNNVLTPILMGARLLSSGKNLKDPTGLLETMVASAQRGADLVKQLLSFAGGIRKERNAVDIEQTIAETRGLLEHTLPKSIQIETVVEQNCSPVYGDATEVSQILMNLSINARDAMPNGGILRIEAEPVHLDQNAAHINPDARPGHYVLLKVSDTGCGMTAEIIDRIFDPFFTTKDVGKGTGLGLATVQGIVKSYDGFINVYSEPGHGTTFSVYVPAIERDLGERPPADGISKASDGKESTVLVVDDEVFILQMTEAALQMNGYEVVTAQNGEEAIAIFSQRHGDFALVLLDMMMPGLDGLQTLDQLRQIDPRVPIIACSGLRTTQREEEVRLHGAKAFLPKPYTETQLFQLLSEVCQSGNS